MLVLQDDIHHQTNSLSISRMSANAIAVGYGIGNLPYSRNNRLVHPNLQFSNYFFL